MQCFACSPDTVCFRQSPDTECFSHSPDAGCFFQSTDTGFFFHTHQKQGLFLHSPDAGCFFHTPQMQGVFSHSPKGVFPHSPDAGCFFTLTRCRVFFHTHQTQGVFPTLAHRPQTARAQFKNAAIAVLLWVHPSASAPGSLQQDDLEHVQNFSQNLYFHLLWATLTLLLGLDAVLEKIIIFFSFFTSVSFRRQTYIIIIIMEICKATTLRLKVLNHYNTNTTRIMYIERDDATSNLTKS